MITAYAFIIKTGAHNELMMAGECAFTIISSLCAP